MSRIDYFFTLQSPWAYLAGHRLEELAARQGASVAYHPLDIAGLFQRTGGTAIGDRHPNRLDYRAQDLPRQAAKLGLPLNLRPAFFPVNTAPASYAVISAAAAGGGDTGALVHGLMRAVWAEDRNIAEDEVIAGCLAAAGFDPSVAGRGMMQAADTYGRNLEEAVARGVFGAPFYIVAETDQRFWGQDRLEDLERHLEGLRSGPVL